MRAFLFNLNSWSQFILQRIPLVNKYLPAAIEVCYIVPSVIVGFLFAQQWPTLGADMPLFLICGVGWIGGVAAAMYARKVQKHFLLGIPLLVMAAMAFPTSNHPSIYLDYDISVCNQEIPPKQACNYLMEARKSGRHFTESEHEKFIKLHKAETGDDLNPEAGG